MGEANKKVAALEAENAKLQQEAISAKEQAKADKEAYRKQLNGQFNQIVQQKVDEATEPLKTQITTLNSNNLNLSNKNVEYQSEIIRLKDKLKDRNRLLAVLGKVLYKLYEVFREAVDALIGFAQGKDYSNYGTIDYRTYLFAYEREAIEKAIDTFSFDNNPLDISDLMAETAKVEGKLTEHEGVRAEREAHDVARTLRNISNGKGYGKGV